MIKDRVTKSNQILTAIKAAQDLGQLVGKKVKHQVLDEDDTPAWYLGTTVDFKYVLQTKTEIGIKYDGYPETYYVFIEEEIKEGDLIFLGSVDQ